MKDRRMTMVLSAVMLMALLAAGMIVIAGTPAYVYADTETWYVDDANWSGVECTSKKEMYVTQDMTAYPINFYEEGSELTFKTRTPGRQYTFKYSDDGGIYGFYYYDPAKEAIDYNNLLAIEHLDAGGENPVIPGVGHYTKMVIRELFNDNPVMGLPGDGIAVYASFVVRIWPNLDYQNSYVYDGKVHVPEVAVFYIDDQGSSIDVPESDYVVTDMPKSSKKPGVYYFGVNYNDSLYIDFTQWGAYLIRPVTPEITKVSAGSKKVTVKWKGFTRSAQKHIDGFVVEYTTDKNFSKSIKRAFASKKSASKTIKKLKSNKTYYFRVCSYVKSDIGEKLISKPSKTRKVKIK